MPPGISLVGAERVQRAPQVGQAARRARLRHEDRARAVQAPARRASCRSRSLTKIMTALVVVDETRPREKARVTKAALRYSGSGVGVLPKGKKVPVEGLLAGLLLPSGNDAAIALADHVVGQREAVRQDDEPAGAQARAALHAVRVVARARAGQPLVRGRPGRDDAAGDGRAADRAARAPQAGRDARSRSRAGGCSSTRRTRCCGLGYRGHDRAEDRLDRRGRPLLRRRSCAAAGASSAWCCCTRRTPACRPSSSSTRRSGRRGPSPYPGMHARSRSRRRRPRSWSTIDGVVAVAAVDRVVLAVAGRIVSLPSPPTSVVVAEAAVEAVVARRRRRARRRRGRRRGGRCRPVARTGRRRRRRRSASRRPDRRRACRRSTPPTSLSAPAPPRSVSSPD